MDEFNIQDFKAMYEKDGVDTLLKLNDFVAGLKGKLEVSEKEKKLLQDKNNMLVESNSRLFLRVGNDNPNAQKDVDLDDPEQDIERELKDFGAKMLGIEKGE